MGGGGGGFGVWARAGATLRVGSGAVAFGDAGWSHRRGSLFHDATLTTKVINAMPCLPGVAIDVVEVLFGFMSTSLVSILDHSQIAHMRGCTHSGPCRAPEGMSRVYSLVHMTGEK